MLPIFYVCSSCGHWIPALEGEPVRCPREEGGEPHALTREIDPAPLSFPELGPSHPFLRYRELLADYHRARYRGMTDAAFVESVMSLDSDSLDQIPDHRSTLSLQCGFLVGAGLWLMRSGNKGGQSDARLEFARSLADAIAPGKSAAGAGGVRAAAAPPSSARVREFHRIRAYQLISWSRQASLNFDRVLLCGRDRQLAAAFGEGLRDAARLGALPRPPRLHVVVREDDSLRDHHDGTIESVLQSMHQETVRHGVLDAARKDPRIRRQVGDSIRAGLRSRTKNNPVRIAAENVLRDRSARSAVDDGAYLIGRSFLETGGYPVVIYDRTVSAAAEVVEEADREDSALLDLVAAALLLRTYEDIETPERICLILP